MIRPRVSIGLPVYNGANFIRRAVQSVLEQDYGDLELVIADNASTDATQSICLEVAARDKRVRYYRNEANLGAAGNYNRVFELARGDYFKWAAHDDECHSSMVRKCVELLDSAPASIVMVYPLGELIDENGRTLTAPLDRIESQDPRPHRRLARLLWSLNMCDPVFGVYRTDFLKKTQLIGRFFGADYVLLGELAMMGEIRELGEILFRLRAHPKRSNQAHRSARDRAAWYDPAAAKQLFVLPNWERMVWELMKSAMRAPLNPFERMKCLAVIPGTHYCRRFRNAGGRAKQSVRRSLGLHVRA